MVNAVVSKNRLMILKKQVQSLESHKVLYMYNYTCSNLECRIADGSCYKQSKLSEYHQTISAEKVRGGGETTGQPV